MSTYIVRIKRGLYKVNNKTVKVSSTGELKNLNLTDHEVESLNDYIEKEKRGVRIQSGIY
jgi:hypothetical protein